MDKELLMWIFFVIGTSYFIILFILVTSLMLSMHSKITYLTKRVDVLDEKLNTYTNIIVRQHSVNTFNKKKLKEQ